MCGMSLVLEEGKIYRAVIVKQEYGHMVFVDFTGNCNAFKKMKRNLELAGAEIVAEMEADKHQIKERVLSLNKAAGLPGVMRAPKAA